MKLIAFNRILMTAALAAVFSPTPALAISSEITKFHLVNCGSKTASRCLVVSASKAEGSSLKQLFSLDNVDVTLTDRNQKPLQTWHSKNGYYDFEENRVVLFDPKATSRETVFELADVDSSTWK